MQGKPERYSKKGTSIPMVPVPGDTFMSSFRAGRPGRPGRSCSGAGAEALALIWKLLPRLNECVSVVFSPDLSATYGKQTLRKLLLQAKECRLDVVRPVNAVLADEFFEFRAGNQRVAASLRRVRFRS